MKIESEIIEQLRKRIKDLIPVRGLNLHIEEMPFSNEPGDPDFIAQVCFKNQKFKLAGEVILQKNLPIFRDKILQLKSYVEQNHGFEPVIIARYLSQDRRIELKKASINFLDLSGNVFLEHGALYIERVGFPNSFPEIRKSRSPFSDKASLILRAILSDKEKLWGIRELAQSVKLDPGFVSRMARELENRNYALRLNSKIRVKDPKYILEDWTREYNYKKNQEAKYFCMAKDPNEIIKKVRSLNVPNKINHAFSLHAGANIISPYAVFNEIHVYIQDLESIEFFKEKLKLSKVQQGENVIFLIPYYKHSVFYKKQKVKESWVVSDIQLYLDLYNYPIRGLEQADHIYEKRLKQLFEG
jgi:DNA-binding transcriptional regulator YhcF (GntR family)